MRGGEGGGSRGVPKVAHQNTLIKPPLSWFLHSHRSRVIDENVSVVPFSHQIEIGGTLSQSHVRLQCCLFVHLPMPLTGQSGLDAAGIEFSRF